MLLSVLVPLLCVAVAAGGDTVLVTSATGRIGKEVVALLSQDGKYTVRAAAHNPAKTDYLKKLGAHEVVHFDLKDPATWTEALAGVTLVYSASLDPLLGHLDRFLR